MENLPPELALPPAAEIPAPAERHKHSRSTRALRGAAAGLVIVAGIGAGYAGKTLNHQQQTIHQLVDDNNKLTDKQSSLTAEQDSLLAQQHDLEQQLTQGEASLAADEATMQADEQQIAGLQTEIDGNQQAAADQEHMLEEEQAALQAKLLADEQTLNIDDHDLSRLGPIAGALTGASQQEVYGQGLGSVSDLPGYGEKVSADTRAELEASTVKILMRPKGSDYWEEYCTGNVVSIDGQTYVTTARHCVSAELSNQKPNNDYVSYDGTNWKAGAFDITNILSDDYAIADPNESMQQREATPITTVTAIVESDTNDIALMKVASTPAFDKIKPLTSYQTAKAPTPGEQVAVYGVPAASDNKPVAGTGIYIGRLTTSDQDGYNRNMDIVALPNVTSPSGDACNFGASGSAAVFADGYVSGPLSRRTNIVNGVGSNGEDNSTAAMSYRIYLEDTFGVDLVTNDAYPTICMFTSNQPDTLQELTHGFGNYLSLADPSTMPTGKGGGGMK